MKNRLLWVFVVIVTLSGLALLVARWKLGPGKPAPTVAIQDGKTVDFSSGKPVVKDSAKEKSSIEKAVKEMDEAAQGVHFSSPAPAAKPPAKK